MAKVMLRKLVVFARPSGAGNAIVNITDLAT
jgi:hypothetical protein